MTDHRIQNPTFEYLLFTNQEKLRAPGWTKTVAKHLQRTYRRSVTQSRWAKFVPWQHEATKKRRPVIFYLDGYTLPINTPQVSQRFRDAARLIRKHPFGLAQYPKKKSRIVRLAKGLVEEGKDTAANVKYTMTWLRSQIPSQACRYKSTGQSHEEYVSRTTRSNGIQWTYLRRRCRCLFATSRDQELNRIIRNFGLHASTIAPGATMDLPF